MKCTLTKEGFTLVELLVVIAIVALLAALIVPQISKSRQAALSAKSVANVRQIFTAFQGHASDNNGSFPSVTDPTNTYRWQYQLFPYLMGRDGDTSSALLFNTPFQSPGATKALIVKQLGASNANNSYVYSYGMNAHLPPKTTGSGIDTMPKLPLSLDHYSSTMLLVDSSMSNALLSHPQIKTRLEHGSERYGGKNTVLFCDGSATMMPFKDLPVGDQTSTDPAVQKLWFGRY